MGKAFWLGIIGGIFGILGAVLAILIQSLSEAFGATTGTSLYYNAAAAIIFSIVGIAGGVLETRKILGAAIMIIGALGVVISISAFGILTLILFLVGGVLILMQKIEQTIPSGGADTRMDERKRYCKNCGAEVIPHSNYCSRCGTGQSKDNI
jgi:hypothetical protein